eukprot:SAG22_NODE_3530_length_1658_cov_2.838358_1_plen_97_part_00
MHGGGTGRATGGPGAARTEALIAAGANVDLQMEDGWTALMWAAFKDHGAVAEALIAAGANVDLQDKDGWTALMKTAFKDHGVGPMSTCRTRTAGPL